MRLLYCVLLFSLLVASSCSHYNYSPNLVLIPALTEQHESMVSLHLGDFFASSNMDVQVAYNPFKNATIFANYANMGKKFTSYNSVSFGSQDNAFFLGYFEGGGGGWYPFGNSELKIGAFAGWGKGFAKNDYGINRIAVVDFQKTFLQPSILYKGDIVRLGMACRFSRLSFTKGSIDVAIEPEYYDAFKKIEADAPFNIAEIGLNIGFYFRPVTLSLSLVQERFFNGQTASSYYFDNGNISLGITCDLHHFYMKKKTDKPAVVR